MLLFKNMLQIMANSEISQEVNSEISQEVINYREDYKRGDITFASHEKKRILITIFKLFKNNDTFQKYCTRYMKNSYISSHLLNFLQNNKPEDIGELENESEPESTKMHMQFEEKLELNKKIFQLSEIFIPKQSDTLHKSYNDINKIIFFVRKSISEIEKETTKMETLETFQNILDKELTSRLEFFTECLLPNESYSEQKYLEHHAKEQQEKLQKFTKEIEEKEKQLTETTKELNKQQKEFEEKEQELNTQQKEFEEKEQELKTQQEELEKKKQELSTLKEEFSTLEATNSEIQNQYKNSQNETTSLKKKLKNSQDTKAELEKEYEKSQQKLQEMESSNEAQEIAPSTTSNQDSSGTMVAATTGLGGVLGGAGTASLLGNNKTSTEPSSEKPPIEAL